MTVRTTRVFTCDEQGCEAQVLTPLPRTWAVRGRKGQHSCPEHVPQPCVKCGRKCRPRRFTAADYPNTLVLGSNGMCRACEQGRSTLPVPVEHVRTVRRMLEDRFDDPDDRLLLSDVLGLLGGD